LIPLISDSSVSSSFIYKNKTVQLHSAIHSNAPATSCTSAACPWSPWSPTALSPAHLSTKIKLFSYIQPYIPKLQQPHVLLQLVLEPLDLRSSVSSSFIYKIKPFGYIHPYIQMLQPPYTLLLLVLESLDLRSSVFTLLDPKR
jgi:hypothetical protein